MLEQYNKESEEDDDGICVCVYPHRSEKKRERYILSKSHNF